MNKPISRPMHGLLTDYPYVALVSSAPGLVGFKDEKVASLLCRVLSGTILVSSFLTRAEWGIARVARSTEHDLERLCEVALQVARQSQAPLRHLL